MNKSKKIAAPKQSSPAAGEKKKRNRRRRKNRNGGEKMTGNGPIALSTARSSSTDGPSGTVIHRSEYLASLLSSASFTVRHTYSINPGLALTFPWLSIVSPPWQYYKFRKFAIRFETISNATISGQVIMTPDYNNTDSAPTSIENALNCWKSVNTVSYRSASLVLDPKKMFSQGSHKFVRTGNPADSINLYDAAKVFIITEGFTGNFVIGNIWADYEIELNTPQTSLVNDVQYNKVTYSYLKSNYAINQGVTGTIPFADFSLNGLNVNGLNIPNPVGGKFTLPVGAYLITIGVVFTNSLSEFSNSSAWVNYNGSSVGIDVVSTSSRDEVVASCYNSMSLSVPVVSNGSDEVSVSVIYTETTGNTGSFLLGKTFICFMSV